MMTVRQDVVAAAAVDDSSVFANAARRSTASNVPHSEPLVVEYDLVSHNDDDDAGS